MWRLLERYRQQAGSYRFRGGGKDWGYTKFALGASLLAVAVVPAKA